MIQAMIVNLLRVGHAPLRDKYKGFNAPHLLVLARMAANAGDWLSTTDIAVGALISPRYARQLLDELAQWELVETREVNRRGDREFTASTRRLRELFWPPKPVTESET